MDAPISPGSSTANVSNMIAEKDEEKSSSGSKDLDFTTPRHDITLSSKEKTFERMHISDSDKDSRGKTIDAQSEACNSKMEGNCETNVFKKGDGSVQSSKQSLANSSMQPINSDSNNAKKNVSQAACHVENHEQTKVKGNESERCVTNKETPECINDSQDDLRKGNGYINADGSGFLPVILNVRGNVSDFDTSEEMCQSNEVISKPSMDKDADKNNIEKENILESGLNILSKKGESGSIINISKTVPTSLNTNVTISSTCHIINSFVHQNVLSSSATTNFPMQSDPALVMDKCNISNCRLSGNQHSSIQRGTMNDSHHQPLSNVPHNSSSSHPLPSRLATGVPRPTKSSLVIGTSPTSLARSSANASLSYDNEENYCRSKNLAMPQCTEMTTIIVNTQRISSSAAPLVHVKSQSMDASPSSLVLDPGNVTDSHHISDPKALIEKISVNCLSSDVSSNLRGLSRQEILDSKLLHVEKKPRSDLTKEYVCEVCGDEFYNKEFLEFHLKRNVFKMTYFCSVCFRGMIFSNKCSFLQHIMKEVSNWQLHLQTEKGFMKLMSYIPTSKHEDSWQSYVPGTTSQRLADNSLCQSSSSTNLCENFIHASVLTHDETNDPILPSDKSASLSSQFSPSIFSPASILLSGATSSKSSSMIQPRTCVSQPLPKPQSGTPLLTSPSMAISPHPQSSFVTKSLATVLKSSVVNTSPKIISMTQSLVTMPKLSPMTQSIATIPKSSSTVTHFVTAIPKPSPVPQSVTTIPKSSQSVATFPQSSLSMIQFLAAIHKSSSNTQSVATVPKSPSVTQSVATVPPKSSSVTQSVAIVPKSSSVTQSVAIVPKSSSVTQSVATVPPKSSSVTQSVVSVPPKSSSVTQSVATVPPKSSSLIPATVLQPRSLMKPGFTFRLPSTKQLIISQLSAHLPNTKAPLLIGTNSPLSNVSRNIPQSSIQIASCHSLASVSCVISNSTVLSDANVFKSIVTCVNSNSTAHTKANISKSTVPCGNTPSGLQSSSDSSLPPLYCSVDSPSCDLGNNLSPSMVHSTEKSPANKYCPICKVGFPTASQLKAHFHSSSSHTFFCNICQMTLFNLCHFAAHKNIHTMEEKKNQVVCPECGIIIPHSKNVFYHLDSCCHFNVINGKTCYCGELLPSVHKAKYHIFEKHLDVLYNCRMCGKAFLSQDQLAGHYTFKHPQSVSSFSLVIVCNLCHQLFFNPSTLQSHIEKEVADLDKKKQRMYQCMLCSLTFLDSSKLNLHMEKDHTHKPKRCTLCFALFKSRQNLVSHIVSKKCEKKLPIKLHVCVDDEKGNIDVPFENSQFASLFKMSNQALIASKRAIIAGQKLQSGIPNTSEETLKRVISSSPSSTGLKSAGKSITKNLGENKTTLTSNTLPPQKSPRVEKQPVLVKISSFDKQKYQCHSCKICIVGLNNYKKHMSRHQSSVLKMGRTHCVVCKKMIVDASIHAHMIDHQRRGVIVCTLCHRRDFANMNAARNHSKNWCYYKVVDGWGDDCFTERQSSVYNKDNPNNGSDVTNAVIEDREDDPPNVSDSNDNQPLLFPCLMCGLAFSNKNAKNEHVSRVHEGTRTLFFCLFCKKKGIRKTFHKRTMASMHIKRKHRIVEPSAISRLIHEEVQNISSGQVIPVEVPTQGDTTGAPPPKRLRIEAEGAFLCGKCGFSDTKPDVFEQHIKMHNPKNEPQCPECGLCFTVKAALKKHLFAIHRIKKVEEYMKEKKICEEEEDFVSDDEEMETVYIDIVNEENNMAEPKSKLKSKTKSVSHSNDPLECNVCYKRFSSETVLKSHIRNHGMAFIRSRRHNKSQEALMEVGPSSSSSS